MEFSLEKFILKGDSIHGNFNLIVFDKHQKNDSLCVISDLHGTIPCFFSQKNGSINISSTLQLVLLASEDYSINEQSLLDYLCLGYTFPEDSLWNAAEMLPKEKKLIVSSKNHVVLKDKITPPLPSPFRSLEEGAKTFFESLNAVVADEIHFLNANQMQLSGGSDSRMLLSVMNPKQRSKMLFRTYEALLDVSNTNLNSMIAKLISQTFNLHLEIHRVSNKERFNLTKFPQSNRILRYSPDWNKNRWIVGYFGSELFGGAFFHKFEPPEYVFSRRFAWLKNKLLRLLITREKYEKMESPWRKLNQKVLAMDAISKEGAFILQILLRSQFTSIYSIDNGHNFIMPSQNHFCGKICPYIDTRIINCFLRCPREFLLNFNLYEYAFSHFSERKLIEIPFVSSMTGYVESIQKFDKTPSVETELSCNYNRYLKEYFSASLFEGTFLDRFSNENIYKIHEPFLYRISDLNCFLLGLKSMNN